MIGNPRKADLLKVRRETLELMKTLAWKMSQLPEGELRAEYEKTIREMGQIALNYKAMMDKEDREGVPEKWVRYYELMEKLDGNQLAHSEVPGEGGAAPRG